MKAYIAGPLCTEKDRKFVEKMSRLCESLRIKTFLPHRDCGLWKNIKDTKRIAEGDLNGFKDCNLVVASLNGFGVGTGTAWEMGYAYSKKLPIIAIKTDRKIEKSIEEISAIIMGTTKIVSNFKDLEREIKKIIKNKN